MRGEKMNQQKAVEAILSVVAEAKNKGYVCEYQTIQWDGKQITLSAVPNNYAVARNCIASSNIRTWYGKYLTKTAIKKQVKQFFDEVKK